MMEQNHKNTVGKWTRRFSGAAGLIFGIILPVIAVVLELMSGMAADLCFNPFPTTCHVVIVASVPVINLLLWICYLRGKGCTRTSLHLLAGFSAAVALAYAILFLPFAIAGFIFCVISFWYLGIGFIGLLPSAPFFGCLTACLLHRALCRQAEEQGVPYTSGFGFGWLLALLVGGLSIVPLALMTRGVAQAASDDPIESAHGVQTLRSLASDRDMATFLSHRSFNYHAFFRPYSRSRQQGLSYEKVHEIYYRVTGKDPDRINPSSRSPRNFVHWDFLQGDEQIGAFLEGLSLADSVWETKTDAKTAIGYAEWTLVFANSFQYADREARLRINLPKDAVVSRVTLWIGGEEREAAFDARGKVRQAYQKIVRAQRDPLLVTTSGPDQIQVQCFPVPRQGGKMKIRLGITTPLNIAADGKSLTFPTPFISARNFTIPRNLPGLPTAQVVPLDHPPAPVAVYADKTEKSLQDAALLRRLVLKAAEVPHTVAVVVDTSASMSPYFSHIAETLKQLPRTSNLELWFADDLPPTKPLLSAAGDGPRDQFLAQAFNQVSCVGGRDNLRPLLSAVQSLQKVQGPTALFWIHTPQPHYAGGTEALAAALAKSARLKFFICPLELGSCPVTETLRPSDRIQNCGEIAEAKDRMAALGTRFQSLATPTWQVSYEKVATNAIPVHAVPADRHLARLWAAQEAIKTYRIGDPQTLAAAQQIALPWSIVTPVTGAVVLETAQQYKENNLTPTDVTKVPTTPEPAHLLLVLLALLVLVGTLLIRAHLRRPVLR